MITSGDAERRMVDLGAALAELRALPAKADRRSITLVSGGGLQVVALRMRAGASLTPHATRGPTTIQVLEGRATIAAGGADLDVRGQQLVALEAGEQHGVSAIEDSTLLLTIAAPPA